MHTQQTKQQPIEIFHETDDKRLRRLSTLRKFSERYSDHTTLAGITNTVFKAQPRHSSKGEIAGNGMLEFGVIVRIGRKVLIDEDAYFRWLNAQQESRG